MTLSHFRMRCRKRTDRYGNWRQFYHDHLGICDECGSVEYLEFHEDTPGHLDKLLCLHCHIKHSNDKYGLQAIRRKYLSKLAEDVNRDILECGGYDGWKRVYAITDKPIIFDT